MQTFSPKTSFPLRGRLVRRSRLPVSPAGVSAPAPAAGGSGGVGVPWGWCLWLLSVSAVRGLSPRPPVLSSPASWALSCALDAASRLAALLALMPSCVVPPRPRPSSGLRRSAWVAPLSPAAPPRSSPPSPPPVPARASSGSSLPPARPACPRLPRPRAASWVLAPARGRLWRWPPVAASPSSFSRSASRPRLSPPRGVAPGFPSPASGRAASASSPPRPFKARSFLDGTIYPAKHRKRYWEIASALYYYCTRTK